MLNTFYLSSFFLSITLQLISVQSIDPGFWNMIRPCMFRPFWFAREATIAQLTS